MVAFKLVLLFSILFAAQEAFAFHYTARLAEKLNTPAKRDLSLNTASSRHTTSNITADLIPAACTDSCPSKVLDTINTCTAEACTCGDATDQAIGTCMTCVVGQGTISSDLGAAVHKQYETTCTHRGVLLASTSDATMVKAGLLSVPLFVVAVVVTLLG